MKKNKKKTKQKSTEQLLLELRALNLKDKQQNYTSSRIGSIINVRTHK